MSKILIGLKILLVFFLSSGVVSGQEVLEEVKEDSDWRPGEYAISMTYGRPTFNNMEFYDQFYGSAPGILQIRAERKLFDAVLPVRIGISGGYFSDSGTPQERSDDGDPQLRDAETGSLELRLIPIQVYAATSYKIPSGRLFALGGWVGLEHLIFEETRTISQSSEGSESSGTVSSGSSDDGKRNVSYGENRSLAVGLNLKFNLSALDPQSIRSLENSLGISSVFLDFFVESTQKLSGNPDLARTVFGAGFSFESLP